MIKKVRILVLLCCVLIAGIGFAQTISVSGTVIGDDGEALPGVTVVQDGTTNGTITNIDGIYKIKVPSEANLVFSFIGFDNKIVPVKGRREISVTLNASVTEIEEVVAVGYGSMRKSDLSGSVAKVMAEELTESPNANLDQALAGKVSGVRVTSNEGSPGEAMSIEIRGATSITGSSEPLYVVDGFPVSAEVGGSLDPEDIASLEILKDASATAIYGSRGANGVVLITTRQGKAGKVSVDVSAVTAVQQINDSYPEVMNLLEYAQYQNDAENEAYVDWQSYADSTSVNWVDQGFKTGIKQQYSLRFNGGEKNTKYTASVSNLDHKGVAINSAFSRLNTGLSIKHEMNDWLSLSLSTKFYKTKKEGTPPIEAGLNNKYFIDLRRAKPIFFTGIDLDEASLDPDDPDGQPNPIAKMKAVDNVSTKRVFIQNVQLDADILKSLALTVRGGYKYQGNKSEKFERPPSYNGRNRNGSAAVSQYSDEDYYVESFLNWTPKVNQLRFNNMAGVSYHENKYSNFKVTTSNFPDMSLGFDDLGSGLEPFTPDSYKSRWQLLSFLGRSNVSIANKYIATVTVRADGSSKFSPGNRWGIFPSGAVAWRVSEEAFMKNQNLISNLKVKTSWGVSGNQRIAPYATQALMGDANYVINNQVVSGLVANSLQSSDLKWETTYQTDFGVEMGLIDNRVSINADLYHKRTKDLLLNADIPGMSGFPSKWENIGEIVNKGVEIDITTRNIKKKNFSWTSKLNISFNRNKVGALSHGQDSYLVERGYGKIRTGAFIIKKGQPLGSMYGYITDGLYSYDDFNGDLSLGESLSIKENVPSPEGVTVMPGSLKYKDLNGDGIINDKDRTIIGNANPVHFGGILNSFKYKQWDFSFLFSWNWGNDVMNANRYTLENPLENTSNQYRTVVDRWKPIVYDEEGTLVDPGNTDATVYRMAGNPMIGFDDHVIEDGSYLRLSSLTLGYNLSKKSCKKLGVKSLRLSTSAQNIWLWSNYSGYDPDVNSDNVYSSSKGEVRGIDYGAYPKPYTMSFSLNVSF